MSEIKIEKLKFPDNIRKRSGMYIGATLNPKVIYRELVDNGNDELLNGYATYVDINIHDDHAIVVDNGRGIPVYIDPDTLVESGEFDSENNPIKVIGETTSVITRALFSESHVGSKFSAEDGKVTMGMNGIGTKATNALSNRFIAIVNLKKKDLSTTLPQFRDAASEFTNPVFILSFRKGLIDQELVCEQASIDSVLGITVVEKLENLGDWSTCMLSYPDGDDIFRELKVKYDTESLNIAAMFLDSKRKIIFNGEVVKSYDIRDAFNKTKFIADETFKVDFEHNGFRFLTIFGWSADDFSHDYRGSVNTLITNEGFHIRFIRNRVLGAALAERFPVLIPSDAQYGLRQFTLVMCNEPQFNSQTKEKLDWITNFNENEVSKIGIKAYTKFFGEHEEYFEALKNRVVEYKREIGKLALKDFVNSVVQKGDEIKRNRGLGADVYDCTSSDRERSELFIVEGKSAGSNLLQARDERYNAVLPLRGKPLNTAKVDDLEAVLANAEMRSMINVIGAGISPFADISKARYGKVVLLADADPDGKNINALLLGTFAVYLPEAIEAGMIYVSDIPLYKQDGKFIFNDNIHELDRSRRFTRFKGLGEMNADELEAVAVNPQTRRLIQVTPENLIRALDIIRTASAKKALMVNEGILVEEA